MTLKESPSFEEFWPYYVAQHLNPVNRALHFAGTASALALLCAAALLRRPALAAAAPLLGYGLAWLGHFAFERNKPATFRWPLLSLRGDARMFALTLSGGMPAEIERLKPHLKGLRAP